MVPIGAEAGWTGWDMGRSAHLRFLATVLVVALLAACGSPTVKPPEEEEPDPPPGGDESVVKVVVGGDRSFALLDDGTMLAWGDNDGYGVLGDGTIVDQISPVPVTVLSGVQDVATGESHTLALDEDGVVWAWGNGFHGQLGRESFGESEPVEVAIDATVVAVWAVVHSSFAIDDEGQVWAWGRNNHANLGDDSLASRSTPQVIAGLPPIAALALSVYATLALAEDGSVWVWGRGYQLGGGDDETLQRVPEEMTALGELEVRQLASGEQHVLALLADGTVLGWGRNEQGQLADLDEVVAEPQPIAGLSGITAIGANSHTSYAVGAGGGVHSWGSSFSGQLGIPRFFDDHSTTIQTVAITGVSQLATAADANHVIALMDDGRLMAWGRNLSGQAGVGPEEDGPWNQSEPTPVDMP